MLPAKQLISTSNVVTKLTLLWMGFFMYAKRMGGGKNYSIEW